MLRKEGFTIKLVGVLNFPSSCDLYPQKPTDLWKKSTYIKFENIQYWIGLDPCKKIYSLFYDLGY